MYHKEIYTENKINLVFLLLPHVGYLDLKHLLPLQRY